VRTPAPHRAELDVHAAGSQVVDRILYGANPHEAQIASARLYRKPRNRLRFDARPVHVELLIAEAIDGNTVRVADELRAEDVAVEPVRAPPLETWITQ
jgi:hypothetical protein